MALKDFDDTNPRTRDKNWKEGIPVAELPKTDEWYPYRIVGGVFSYAQHWIEFTNKTGEKKRYPVDCANWDADTESSGKKGGCPACEAGLRPSVRYMMNVIDRSAQSRGDADPVRALDIPPTVMKQLIDLKKLNIVKGEAKPINHPKFGCDVFLQKQRSKKRGGIEWQAQKGERGSLSEEEMALELISFDEHWLEPDVHKIREDLKRHGYFEDATSSEDAKMPKSGNKKRSSDDEDDEDFDAPKRTSTRKAPLDEDDAEESVRKPAKAAKPPVDEDEDDEDAPPPKKAVVAPKKATKPPVDEDEDEDDEDAPPPKKATKPAVMPPAAKKAAKPPVDEDEDEDAPPPKKATKPAAKRPPADDDFEDDFEDV